MRWTVLLLIPALASCGSKSGIAGFDAFERQVQKTKIGHDADQWIEMKNIAGVWERTGLIFGYADDYEECIKAIAGLKRSNEAREYRCVPAN